jgi:hypothetical protein
MRKNIMMIPSVSFSFSGRLLTQAKKQGGNAFGGRFNQSLTCRNFFSYRKKKSIVDLFESYALQLVSGMLLYERIKLQQKKLYLEAIKNLIFQYEHQYNDRGNC